MQGWVDLVLLSFDLQCIKVISLSFICVVQVFHVRLVCVLCVLCVYGPSARNKTDDNESVSMVAEWLVIVTLAHRLSSLCSNSSPLSVYTGWAIKLHIKPVKSLQIYRRIFQRKKFRKSLKIWQNYGHEFELLNCPSFVILGTCKKPQADIW